jgi:hypothetical protein
MDTVDFGELYAYTAVDIYTREAQVVLLPRLTSEDGGKPLEIVMAYFGSCELLQSDGGKEFGGEFEEKAGCYAQRHRMAGPIARTNKPLWRAFTALYAKNVLAGLSTSVVRGKSYRGR